MRIILRQVVPTDNLALARMIRFVFEEHGAPQHGTVYSDPTTDALYELFRQPGSVLWVAELNGMPLGCCGIYPTPGLDDDCAELVKFYLAGEARGRGTGRALMQKCVDSAREMGYSRLYIESLPEFSKAVRIYEKIGFKYLDQPLIQSEHPSCTIWMVKELSKKTI
ncbi:MAG: GNAT family N-acetyltransferase [Bacteroidota bacterium]